jgi:hypothetical protein
MEMAPWHRAQPDLLQAALAHALAAAPALAPLTRLVLPWMPRRLRATSTLRSAGTTTALLPLPAAIAHEHIAIRTATFAYAIAVDCDHADWPERLAHLADSYGLPPPTWICADPWSGRAHLVWWLQDAVLLSAQGRAAPRRLLAIVTWLLTAACDGDRGYTGPLTRNPWHCGPAPAHHRQRLLGIRMLWEAHAAAATPLRHAVIAQPVRHTLAALRQPLAAWQDDTGTRLPARRASADPAAADADAASGCRLFHVLRRRVYQAWQVRPLSAAEIRSMAAEVAAELGSPISDRQRDGMARRIHRWMVERYTARRVAGGRAIRRGRDRAAAAGLGLAQKQAVAGRRTAAARREATAAKLQQALAHLGAAGEPVTQAALAAAAGVSERTVQRWQASTAGDRRCASGRGTGAAALSPVLTP